MASRMDDVMTALVATFTAALSVPVYDGPALVSVSPPDWVQVGEDGDPQSDAVATFEQEWADLAATTRYERGEIPCGAVSWSGATDMAAVRVRAFGLVAACEAALLADRSLGGVVMSAQLTHGGARWVQNKTGAAVVAVFTVTYMAQV